MKLTEIISELKKYDRSLLVFRNGTNELALNDLEKKLNYNLPNDFKEFLVVSNGAIIDCQEFYGIINNERFKDLYGNYTFEKDEVGNPIRDYYLPICPDGMGNHNCLDLKSLSPDGQKCNIIFWQHDKLYSDNVQPDIDASSFTQFLENLLKEISENYNYDGTEK